MYIKSGVRVGSGPRNAHSPQRMSSCFSTISKKFIAHRDSRMADKTKVLVSMEAVIAFDCH
jgi:hypothetical protein